jgi:hypothetical protein
MDFAIWAYPWDLLDEGVEVVADRLAEIGVTEITLATNYHTVQTYHPHNPERSTFFARASTYFQPSNEYGRLRPTVNETMGETDWLAEIADEVEDTHLSLNSWTVGCHNSRLGMENRDLTLQNPYGDDLVFGLCPSKPAVQEYLRTLLADLDSRAPFERIELETFDYFYGTGFGWHHDKFHVELGDLGEFLFGLCFCEECREHAETNGVDVETARNQSVAALDAISAGRLPSDIDVAGWMVEHPSVLEYALARMETLTDVFADLDAAVDSAEVGYYIANFGAEDSWKHGADLDRLAEHMDYYTALAYGETREQAVGVLRTAQTMTDAPVHAGILPGYPLVDDEATLVDIVDGFAESGTERVSFYNYGLLPERNLDWIGTATASYR